MDDLTGRLIKGYELHDLIGVGGFGAVYRAFQSVVEREVIVLQDPTSEFTVLIDAPVHAVFEYCLDPHGMYVGDPMMKVVDATLTPDGVGTKAQLKAKTPLFTETVSIEYTEVVPDERIVFEADAVMVWFGLGRGISIATHELTWTFDTDYQDSAGSNHGTPTNASLTPGRVGANALELVGTGLDLVVVVQNPPMWQRAFDRLLDKSARKMFNGRLARIKAAVEEQATTVG